MATYSRRLILGDARIQGVDRQKISVFLVMSNYILSYSRRLFWMTSNYMASFSRSEVFSGRRRVASQQALLGDELHDAIFQKTAVFTNSEVLKFLQANFILLRINYVLHCGLKLYRNRLPVPFLSSLWLPHGLLRARSSRCNLTDNGNGSIAHSL